MGPNGAGKSVVMKCVTGMDDYFFSSGESFINGILYILYFYIYISQYYFIGFSTTYSQVQSRNITGVCPQFDSLIETLTIREILTEYSNIRGVLFNFFSICLCICLYIYYR